VLFAETVLRDAIRQRWTASDQAPDHVHWRCVERSVARDDMRSLRSLERLVPLVDAATLRSVCKRGVTISGFVGETLLLTITPIVR
jgi:hypothetical protein